MKTLHKKIVRTLIGTIGAIVVLLAAVRYSYQEHISMHGTTGGNPTPPDKPTLDSIRALDRQNHNATFVLVNKIPGAETMRDRVIVLPPIDDELRIDFDKYVHKGHTGPLYIILPDTYAGPKEKFILKSFPDYKGWYGSMLSDKFVMYAAK